MFHSRNCILALSYSNIPTTDVKRLVCFSASLVVVSVLLCTVGHFGNLKTKEKHVYLKVYIRLLLINITFSSLIFI